MSSLHLTNNLSSGYVSAVEIQTYISKLSWCPSLVSVGQNVHAPKILYIQSYAYHLSKFPCLPVYLSELMGPFFL